MMKYDVIIIGAGAVGCAIARELAAFDLRICVLEKEADVCFGTSGRNSGVVHAGFNNKTGSLKAEFCVEGSRSFETLAKELGIKYKKTGKLVTGFSDEDRSKLEGLKYQGEVNGVKGLEIIDRQAIDRINPEIRGNFALLSPETAIFDPFEYTIALAEQAFFRGAEFLFLTEVMGLEWIGDRKEFKIGARSMYPEQMRAVTVKQQCDLSSDCPEVELCADIVINAAGLYSAEICRMAGIDRYEIKPCRGEYHILENRQPSPLKLPVYPIPDEKNGVLGVHLTPTTGGNIIIGPSAEFLEEKDDYSTTESIMSELTAGGSEILPEIAGNPAGKSKLPVIRSFAGIRPKLSDHLGELKGDFVIEASPTNPHFIYLVGIESPGITASMPIAKYVLKLINEILEERLKKKLAGLRNITEKCDSEAICMTDGRAATGSISEEADNKMICRCELVTASEILRAFDDIIKIGAYPTIKGIKNRTRAFMGNCQGGFCTVDTAVLLESRRNFSKTLLSYSGPGSELFIGELK